MRTFKHGDPDPGDIHSVITNGGTVFHRNHHNRWCNASHASNPNAMNNPLHLGTPWEFLTDRCGPLTAEA